MDLRLRAQTIRLLNLDGKLEVKLCAYSNVVVGFCCKIPVVCIACGWMDPRDVTSQLFDGKFPSLAVPKIGNQILAVDFCVDSDVVWLLLQNFPSIRHFFPRML